MANKNDFKAFALDPNANVTAQAAWEALPALLSGFTSGKASSAQVNKAIRQATTIAALIGQFIANSGVDALDNADVNGLVTKFTDALTRNLSLGTAATKNVGTGTNQIPDMSSFTYSNGVYKFPNGLIIQLFSVTPSGNNLVTTVTFPLVFPYSSQGIFSTHNSSPTGQFATFDSVTRSGALMRIFKPNSIDPVLGAGTVTILAIGR